MVFSVLWSSSSFNVYPHGYCQNYRGLSQQWLECFWIYCFGFNANRLNMVFSNYSCRAIWHTISNIKLTNPSRRHSFVVYLPVGFRNGFPVSLQVKTMALPLLLKDISVLQQQIRFRSPYIFLWHHLKFLFYKFRCSNKHDF